MDYALRIILVVCGYKLCYNWKCPYFENGDCVARRLLEEQVMERFAHTLATNPDFRHYVFDRDKSLVKGCIMK